MGQQGSLFFLFLQAGCLGYADPWGSVYALSDKASSMGWLSVTEWLNFWGLASLLPGGFTLNVASFIGFSNLGFWGMLWALLGVTLPAFIFAILAVQLQHRPRWQAAVGDATYFLPMTALGLLIACFIPLAKTLPATSEMSTPWHIGITFFFFVATLIGVLFFRLRAWLMVLLCGVAGIILF